MMGQIKQMVVGEYKWVKESDFLQGMALCQLIPGATMVQMVTYIGYRLRGFWGALLSSIAFVLPAFVALVILSALYFKMQTLPFIQVLFKVLGTIVIALILNAGISLGKSILKDWKTVLISVLSFAAFFYKLNILLVFLFAALAALLLRPKINQPKAASPSEKPEQDKEKREGPSPSGVPCRLNPCGSFNNLCLGPSSHLSLLNSIQNRSPCIRRRIYNDSFDSV